MCKTDRILGETTRQSTDTVIKTILVTWELPSSSNPVFLRFYNEIHICNSPEFTLIYVYK